MVREYNDHALAAGIPEEKMHAVQGNILAPSLPPSESQEIPFAEKEWFDFDIILLSMALHHVPSPSDAITKLTARLAQGGVLIIIDWLLSSIVYHDSGEPRFGLPSHHGGGNNNHAHNVVPGSEHTITRAGFEKEEMEGFFRDAGCVDVGFLGFEEMTRLGDGEGAVEQKLFVARTRKG